MAKDLIELILRGGYYPDIIQIDPKSNEPSFHSWGRSNFIETHRGEGSMTTRLIIKSDMAISQEMLIVTGNWKRQRTNSFL